MQEFLETLDEDVILEILNKMSKKKFWDTKEDANPTEKKDGIVKLTDYCGLSKKKTEKVICFAVPRKELFRKFMEEKNEWKTMQRKECNAAMLKLVYKAKAKTKLPAAATVKVEDNVTPIKKKKKKKEKTVAVDANELGLQMPVVTMPTVQLTSRFEEVNIFSFNIFKSDKSGEFAATLNAYIQEQQCQLVCLQEVTSTSLNLMKGKFKKDNVFDATNRLPLTTEQKNQHNIIVAPPLPLDSSHPSARMTLDPIAITDDNSTYPIVGVHCKIGATKDKLALFTMHTPGGGGKGEKCCSEMKNILKFAHTWASDTVIGTVIIGDMNWQMLTREQEETVKKCADDYHYELVFPTRSTLKSGKADMAFVRWSSTVDKKRQQFPTLLSCFVEVVWVEEFSKYCGGDKQTRSDHVPILLKLKFSHQTLIPQNPQQRK